MSIDLRFTEAEAEKLMNQVPYTIKVRKYRIDKAVNELKRRNFKTLDDSDQDDLKKVVEILTDLFPDTSSRKILEYAHVAIRLWNKEKVRPQ